MFTIFNLRHQTQEEYMLRKDKIYIKKEQWLYMLNKCCGVASVSAFKERNRKRTTTYKELCWQSFLIKGSSTRIRFNTFQHFQRFCTIFGNTATVGVHLKWPNVCKKKNGKKNIIVNTIFNIIHFMTNPTTLCIIDLIATTDNYNNITLEIACQDTSIAFRCPYCKNEFSNGWINQPDELVEPSFNWVKIGRTFKYGDENHFYRITDITDDSIHAIHFFPIDNDAIEIILDDFGEVNDSIAQNNVR
jgi:hypothetical protein